MLDSIDGGVKDKTPERGSSSGIPPPSGGKTSLMNTGDFNSNHKGGKTSNTKKLMNKDDDLDSLLDEFEEKKQIKSTRPKTADPRGVGEDMWTGGRQGRNNGGDFSSIEDGDELNKYDDGFENRSNISAANRSGEVARKSNLFPSKDFGTSSTGVIPTLGGSASASRNQKNAQNTESPEIG